MFVMRRREFVSLLGGVAAAWPLSARAPSRGSGGWFLSPLAPGSGGHLHEVFRRGLAEGGYVDGAAG